MDPSKAKWSLDVCGKEVRVGGGLIRIGFLDAEGYQFLEDPKAALDFLRNSRPRIDIFTFIQRLSQTSPRSGYQMEWDNFAALRVASFDDWFKNQIDYKVRNKIKKAAKSGVVVREVPFDDALVCGIHAIYNESPVRQGKPFWHYGKDVETVRRMSATFLERATFIGAYLGDKLIGFIKLVSDENRNQAGLMHIVSMVRYRDKAPTNALIAQAVKSCAERGIPYLWYANFSYGKRHTDSLAEFKRHNGFVKMDIPRYYVPLTLTGRLALRMGLHHSLVDRVPETVILKYRSLRNRWYSKKLQGLENAQSN